MPKILEDRRQAIARNNPNLSKSSTYAIATSALQKEGKMPKKYAGGGTVDDATRQQLGQLSPEYWSRVGRQAAIARAAQPNTRALDQRDRTIDRYVAPPSPSGGVNTSNYCKGGKVISTKEM